MAKSSFIGEVLHCNAVRMRVTGSGSLNVELLNLDSSESDNLYPITLASPTGIEPTQIANFKSQRMQVKVSTDAIDEWFSISKIIVFVKPVEAEYPR